MDRGLETACVREHDFVLVLTGVSELTDDCMNALFEAGCDDATPSVRHGRIYLTFSRTAASLKDALLSAIRNVRDAGLGADVLRIDVCNLVTQADIGRRIGRSRQQVHQYVTGARGPGGFPPPACDLTEGTPLWYWCEVASWLACNNMISADAVREAQEIDLINLALEWQHQKQSDPELFEEVFQSLARD